MHTETFTPYQFPSFITSRDVLVPGNIVLSMNTLIRTSTAPPPNATNPNVTTDDERFAGTEQTATQIPE